MYDELILKQKAFFEAGYTLDPRGRRAALQILANTIKEKAAEGGEAEELLAEVQVLRKQLHRMSRFALVKALLARWIPTGNGGFPDPKGTAVIEAGERMSSLSKLFNQLAIGNTAVIMIAPDTQADGTAVRSIIDETFTEDYVAVVDGTAVDIDLHAGSADAEGDGFRVFVAE